MTGQREIDDFTRIDLDAAAGQWSRIMRRKPYVVGHRQEDFLPIEILLCHCASRLVDHRRYGSSSAHTAPSPVPELAALLHRPPTSILAKMANLDGSRSHGGRWDRVAATAWAADTWREDALFAIVLTAARRSGIDARALPDFFDRVPGP